MGYSVPIVDFVGPLRAIGTDLGNMARERQLRSAFAGFNGNYDEAANKLMQMGLVDEATRLFTAGQLAKYREVQGNVALDKAQPSLEDRIAEKFLFPDSVPAQPSYLGPSPDIDAAVEAADSEASSPTDVPGTATVRPSGVDWSSAPGFVVDKYAPTAVKKKLEQEGQGAGNRASARQALIEAAPAIQSLIDRQYATAAGADQDTLQNALGPWQGVPEAKNWSESIAQTFGGINNYFDQVRKNTVNQFGPEGNVSEFLSSPGGAANNTSNLRSKINSTQSTLINQLRRVQRIVGEGSQSDRELEQIVIQAGDLTKAKNLEDFNDRLTSIAANLRAMGIPVQMPGQGKAFSDQLAPEGAAPRVNKVQTVPISPSGEVMAPADTGGGVEVPGATKDPRGAYTGPLPENTIISDGKNRLIKRNGKWVPYKR